MILVVTGFPQVAISIEVIENEDASESIFQRTVWYNDFVPAVRECAKTYDIEKVIMFGPTDYLKGLARMINDIVDDIEIDEDVMEEI